MHKSHYQPKRSVHLYLAQQLKTRYGWDDQVVVVHHVLEDTPNRLYVQVERRGIQGIFFERVEL